MEQPWAEVGEEQKVFDEKEESVLQQMVQERCRTWEARLQERESQEMLSYIVSFYNFMSQFYDNLFR